MNVVKMPSFSWFMGHQNEDPLLYTLDKAWVPLVYGSYIMNVVKMPSFSWFMGHQNEDPLLYTLDKAWVPLVYGSYIYEYC